jgi:DNA-binding transcriptional LysR family regulator
LGRFRDAGDEPTGVWDARSIAIDLRHFRSFVAVAEEGRIGRAATRLYITQPALSRQIQQLEREIGAPLLVRVPHGVELTGAGRELLDKARVALEAADVALAVGQPQQPHGRLVLGVPLAGGRMRWYELTQAFVDRFGAVEVEMREALSEQLQRQVLERELDGAVVLAPRRLEGLRYSHVMNDRVSVFANRDHPLAGRPELALADLDGQVITLLGGASGSGSGFNAAVQALFAGSGSKPRFDGTSQVYPPSAALDPGYLSVTVAVDYPDGVVRIPLVPPQTLPFAFVQRAETNRSTVSAYARFAADHLATTYAGGIAPS